MCDVGISSTSREKTGNKRVKPYKEDVMLNKFLRGHKYISIQPTRNFNSIID